MYRPIVESGIKLDRRCRWLFEGCTIGDNILPVPSSWWLALGPGPDRRACRRTSALLPLPHELRVSAVGMADEEVHVEVAQIHLGDQAVAGNELPNSMQPFRLEMLVPNATGGLPEVHTASHLVETVGGLRWQLLGGSDLDVVL